MTLVYIAGPFRAPNSWLMEQNIRRAEEYALIAWRMGAAVICPHTNTRFFQGAAPDNVWLEGDLEMVMRCDVVFAIPGWKDSEGAKEEVRTALAMGIPVVHNLEELRCLVNTSSTTKPESTKSPATDPGAEIQV